MYLHRISTFFSKSHFACKRFTITNITKQDDILNKLQHCKCFNVTMNS